MPATARIYRESGEKKMIMTKEATQKWLAECQQADIEIEKQIRKENKQVNDKAKERKKKYYQKNKEKIRKYQQDYHKKKLERKTASQLLQKEIYA